MADSSFGLERAWEAWDFPFPVSVERRLEEMRREILSFFCCCFG